MKNIKIIVDKLIEGKTTNAGRDYLQVYVNIIDEVTGEKVTTSSFFVRGKNIDFFKERLPELLKNRNEAKILELEKQIEELKKKEIN